MRPVVILLLLAACAAAPPPAPDPVRTRRAQDLAFLADTYGYHPGETAKERRALADLLQRPGRMAGLRNEKTVAFAADLTELTGYRFRPADCTLLAAAAAGPGGEALADPAVRELLTELAATGLLDVRAGRRMLTLDRRRAGALLSLASDPGGRARIRWFAERLGYRFRPGDAPRLLEDWTFPEDDAAWLADLLTQLGTAFRPTWRPEIEVLLGARPAVDTLRELAAESTVVLRGPAAVLVLARLAEDDRPLSEDDAERFRALARHMEKSNSADFLHLLPLARVEGLPELVDELARRHDYRLDPADGSALRPLLPSGIPDVDLPSWVTRDRLPLTHPGALLSEEPAAAFADPNDLRFMEAVEVSRPELAERRRETLEFRLSKRLGKLPRQFRTIAPYSETEEDLAPYSTPDLLKALMLLEELQRDVVVRQLVTWAEEDMADRSTEFGGYVRLTPEGRLRFELAGAAAGRDDRLHLPPDAEGAALDFHFHARDGDEAWWAGPSSGAPGTDLYRAEFHRTDGVVITKLSGRRVNVDLYVSTKRVLDLGVYGP